jgi:hypothetical protein
MPVVAERGNLAGRTSLTTAVGALTGTMAGVLVSVDISDIVAAQGLTAAEKRAQSLRRLLAEFARSVESDARTDAAINQQIADAQARAAAELAARPAGSL